MVLRKRSMRRGIWYKVLNVYERAQVDLTLRVVKWVRSSLLARVLDLIIAKLSEGLQSKVLVMMKSVGFPAALRICRIAQSWGHRSAENWVCDQRFARFLAVMHLNAAPLITSQGKDP